MKTILRTALFLVLFTSVGFSQDYYPLNKSYVYSVKSRKVLYPNTKYKTHATEFRRFTDVNKSKGTAILEIVTRGWDSNSMQKIKIIKTKNSVQRMERKNETEWSKPVTFLKFPLKVGMEWDSMGESFKVAAKGTVYVDAGIFDDVFVIIHINGYLANDLYYAPDIGLIQMEWDEGANGEFRYELMNIN